MEPRVNAVVFENLRTGWVGSAPIYHTRGLEDLADADLEELLEQAVGRG